MRVLVVDDDASVRETLSELLRAFGHHVTTAGDYAEAASMLESMLGQPSWDVMLVDQMLPGGSGQKLALTARDRGIGAVLCSGHPHQIAEMQRQGIAHLAKPFSGTTLDAALAAVAPRTHQHTAFPKS